MFAVRSDFAAPDLAASPTRYNLMIAGTLCIGRGGAVAGAALDRKLLAARGVCLSGLLCAIGI